MVARRASLLGRGSRLDRGNPEGVPRPQGATAVEFQKVLGVPSVLVKKRVKKRVSALEKGFFYDYIQ